MQKSNLALFLPCVLYIAAHSFPVFNSSCNNRADKEGVSYITSSKRIDAIRIQKQQKKSLKRSLFDIKKDFFASCESSGPAFLCIVKTYDSGVGENEVEDTKVLKG